MTSCWSAWLKVVACLLTLAVCRSWTMSRTLWASSLTRRPMSRPLASLQNASTVACAASSLASEQTISIMTALIEIVCSDAKEEAAQATVEAFCKEASGRLIGRRVNEEAHNVLLMVQLLQTASVSKHATTFSHALQQEVIASFRYVTYD